MTIKLSDPEVLQVRTWLSNGLSGVEISRRLGINSNIVYAIKNHSGAYGKKIYFKKCKCNMCSRSFASIGESHYCYDCSIKIIQEKKLKLKK